MSRIGNAFKNKKPFIGFVTGGDPSIARTKEYIRAMIEAGTDLVEIGVPFSDPIAEGPVIQAANIRALAAGTTVDKLFGLVADLRRETEVPLVFLTYLNPVFHYGYEAFFARAEEAGLDGIIIPDLPGEEQGEVRPYAASHGVDLISLVAPTSEQRIRTIASEATGFLYIVSSMGVTGVRSEIRTDLPSIIASARAVSETPIAVGFGIHTPEQAAEISKIADGVIVGSRIVKIIEEHPDDAETHLSEYVRAMKSAIGS
ncbi:MAG: tryptophan synthase subunit alpha [Clostridiales Family XIII bacterium]|jgi:tryptophan synthase alpha chain|nr:tryptophan synthase subunit alpha [Clostridiales Family XIII bacterium]